MDGDFPATEKQLAVDAFPPSSDESKLRVEVHTSSPLTGAVLENPLHGRKHDSNTGCKRMCFVKKETSF